MLVRNDLEADSFAVGAEVTIAEVVPGIVEEVVVTWHFVGVCSLSLVLVRLYV